MSTAPQVRQKTVSEVRNVAVDMRGKLDSGELLALPLTIIEEVTNYFTINNESINSSPVTILGQTVPIGQAVLFRVLGGIVGRYSIRITVGTDGIPPQTLVENLTLLVVED